MRLSKQLATIPTDAPVKLELEKLKMQEPDADALRELYGELGFTSLLREIAPLTDDKKPEYTRARFGCCTAKISGERSGEGLKRRSGWG